MIKDIIKNSEQIQQVLREAGALIMDYYKSDNFWTEDKEDSSPVTEADQAANDYILSHLKEISPHPIISEEDGKPRLEVEYNQPIFWLLDPLDGTKHFIKKDGEFVISLGLVTRDQPLAGFVYSPVYEEMYWAVSGHGAYKNGHKFTFHSNRHSLISFSSGFHAKPESREFIERLGISTFKRMGSALKLCRIAEGQADLYPRFGPTSEWDVAGAHCILKEAGCRLLEIRSLKEMRYGKPKFLNRGFVAYRGDLEIVPHLQEFIRQRREARKETKKNA